MHVLFVAPVSVDTATSRYRCAHIAEALTYAGHQADVVCADDNNVVVQHDVVVLHRLHGNGVGQRFLDAARSVGAVALYGVDDLIFTREFAIHAGMLHTDDPVRYRYHRWEADENRTMLHACDGVLTSTEYLAEQIREETNRAKPVWVVRNFPGEELRDRLQKSAREALQFRRIRRDDRVTLGYLSGSPTHDGDLADIAQPLANVMAMHPHVRLLIVGRVKLPPLLEPFAAMGRIRRHQPVPWRDLPALMSGIDVNLAPLDPTRAFAHAKSEVKFVEAALAGIPTLAGWAAGFADGLREGECLLANTAAEWEELLTRLVSDARYRADRALIDSSVGERATVAAQSPHIAEVFSEAERLRPAREGGVQGSAIVRRPLKEEIEQRVRDFEAKAFGAVLRYRRHARLLTEELER